MSRYSFDENFLIILLANPFHTFHYGFNVELNLCRLIRNITRFEMPTTNINIPLCFYENVARNIEIKVKFICAFLFQKVDI